MIGVFFFFFCGGFWIRTFCGKKVRRQKNKIGQYELRHQSTMNYQTEMCKIFKID